MPSRVACVRPERSELNNQRDALFWDVGEDSELRSFRPTVRTGNNIYLLFLCEQSEVMKGQVSFQEQTEGTP